MVKIQESPISIIEDQALAKTGGAPPWRLLVVDDDETVHQATRFALDDFIFEGRELEIISAYSASEAQTVITTGQEPAMILLDVVMETETIGLDLVRWIREKQSNSNIRIVLRTGQPGYAPELQVVRDYDINDYKEKNQMTASMLVTTVYAALRSYRDIIRLEHQASQLQHALGAAESANRAKSNFITHMSHEFRTPLNGILGLSEMIATEVLGPVGNPKYKEYAWDIIASGKRLEEMIDDVLHFSESDEQRALEIRPFDLHDLISELSKSQDRKRSSSAKRTKPDKPAMPANELILRADRQAVRTMLMNLISNALKHNQPKCSVRVTAKRLNESELVISVIDDGNGIDEEILKRLGDAFNLEGDPYITRDNGLGLGLVTAKTIIERHGGNMTVTSEKGKGTAVRLYFPVGSLLNEQKGRGERFN